MVTTGSNLVLTTKNKEMNDILLMMITTLFGIWIGFVIGIYTAKKVVKKILNKHNIW